MRVDDGRDRIGGIVKPVDEFEAQRDQQGKAQKQEGPDRLGRAAGLRNIVVDIPRHERQGADDDSEIDYDRANMKRFVQLDPARRRTLR